MEKIFKDILNQLVVLNNFLDKKAFNEDDFQEEEESYNNFLQRLKELNELLVVYKNTSVNDVYAGSKNIMELHILMSALSNYVQNLHDRIIDVLKQYPMSDGM